MTKKQQFFYLREWQAAWKAHWSGTRDGEALARRDRPEHCPIRDRVVAMAQRLIVTRGHGLKLNSDTLRHACHVIAFGRDLSSMKMTNKQLDQVISIFRQLAGVDLGAMVATEQAIQERNRIADGRARQAIDPDAPTPLPDADRKRLIYALSHIDLPSGYLETLARDAHGTSDWRTLPTSALHKLRITAACRAASRQIAGIKRAPAPANA